MDAHTHTHTHAHTHSVLSCHYSKETDKLNVWVALLNLENMFGTPESLTSIFQQALQHNDPERVYWKMIGIYTKSGKTDVRVTGICTVYACGCVHVGVSGCVHVGVSGCNAHGCVHMGMSGCMHVGVSMWV